MVEKKTPLHKKFRSIYRAVISATWPNFTIAKYKLKISNIHRHIKFRRSIMNRCSIKKLCLKILQYSLEYACVGVSLLESLPVKIQTFSRVTLLERDSNAGVSL